MKGDNYYITYYVLLWTPSSFQHQKIIKEQTIANDIERIIHDKLWTDKPEYLGERKKNNYTQQIKPNAKNDKPFKI